MDGMASLLLLENNNNDSNNGLAWPGNVTMDSRVVAVNYYYYILHGCDDDDNDEQTLRLRIYMPPPARTMTKNGAIMYCKEWGRDHSSAMRGHRRRRNGGSATAMQPRKRRRS